MNFDLDPELERIQKQARELAADFATRASQHDQESTAPDENYAKLKQAGFYGLVAPKQYGGSGAGVLGWVVAAEELAQGCPSTASGDLAPSFIKRGDRRCRKCFGKRYGSAAQANKARIKK
jgi:alkylation response protein AidB-like acyl-CoA dehydrogenase